MSDLLSIGQAALSPEESRYEVADNATFDSVLDLLLGADHEPADEFDGNCYLDVDCWSVAKAPAHYHLSPWAIAPEYMLAIADSVMREVEDQKPITASNVTPFSRRGSAQVPISAATPATVLSFTIPTGYQLWVDGYALDLLPSSSNELNYIWEIFVNGSDILSKGSPTIQLGRPVKNGNKVPIGYSKSTMILALPGSQIQVIVTAANNLGASDNVTAAIFGMLEAIS